MRIIEKLRSAQENDALASVFTVNDLMPVDTVLFHGESSIFDIADVCFLLRLTCLRRITAMLKRNK